MAAGSVEFRLLGPVEVVADGATLPIGGRRQRALLALLLVEHGRAVSAELLAEELWLGRPPDGYRTTIRAYVSRLRRALGQAAAFGSGPAGYSLEVPPDAVDAVRFERLLEEGSVALERGAAVRAGDRLREALALWRGRALDGAADGGTLLLEAERLEELRLRALERRIEADLEVGRAAELVEELELVVREHPYRERLWRHLMLALYRSERQAEALAAYRRARAILVEDVGLEPGEELRRLEQAILRHEVPLLRPPEQRHNLPAPVTSFVGRERQLDEVARLVAAHRLVTITGVGGVGKTRLALEAARRALPDLPAGVAFCDLAPLADPALVAAQVAAALGVRERTGTTIVQRLAARLRDAELLLVLDNCEHVRDDCAELAQTLLAACPQVRVLATSRVSLGVEGEVDYPLPPLALASASDDPDEAGASEAVSLFLARAREARPRLAVDAAARSAAARICADLDGLPLAIELAAARVKALSLDEIAARLNDRFRFLVSWRRLSAARHRTLREAIDWSYELLQDEERSFLSRLSVFAGGFTLSASAAVCLQGDEDRALALTERLVESSLLVAEEREGRTRYRLLETIRRYAAERLDDGKTAELRRLHADWMLAFAERTRTSRPALLHEWVTQVEPERDNLRAALVWSREAGAADLLLRLTTAVWRFWWISGALSEGRDWLEIALRESAGSEPGLRAEALEGAAGLAWAAGDLDRAQRQAEAALAAYAGAGDSRGERAALIVLGHVALARGRFRTAESRFERSRRLAEAEAARGACPVARSG